MEKEWVTPDEAVEEFETDLTMLLAYLIADKLHAHDPGNPLYRLSIDSRGAQPRLVQSDGTSYPAHYIVSHGLCLFRRSELAQIFARKEAPAPKQETAPGLAEGQRHDSRLWEKEPEQAEAGKSKGRRLVCRSRLSKYVKLSVATIQKTLEPAGLPAERDEKGHLVYYQDEVDEWVREHSEYVEALRNRKTSGKGKKR